MSTANKETILSRMNVPALYQAHLPSLKVNGKAESTALCPFHDDHTPSFSVNLESGLWNCLAGCGGGDVFSFVMRLMGVNYPTAIQVIADQQGIEEVKPRVVATFPYRDAEGNTLYRKERLEPGRDGRRKEFRFLHRKRSQWVFGRGCDPVLYNLPDVIESKYVLIAEGEGKADLLTSWGLAATCLDSGGRSPWRAEYVEVLGGKEIVILPDNDEPGREYAQRIAVALHGHVELVKVVTLPGLLEKGDIIDWARLEGNNRDRLLGIIQEAPVWTPEAVEIPGVIRLETVQPETVTWLWPGRIPAGKITLLDGDPGLGKSTFTIDLAARTSTGSPMPDGAPGIKGGVVIMSLEDGLRDTIVPRLRAAGADISRIVALQGVPGVTPEGGVTLRYPTVEDVDLIARVCRQEAAKLVVIDPLMGYLGGHRNSWRDQDVRAALGPLAQMAEEVGAAVPSGSSGRPGLPSWWRRTLRTRTGEFWQASRITSPPSPNPWLFVSRE